MISASFLTVASTLWSKIWPIAAALILFAILITIHEFGHFSVAKILGIRVNEFSVGFGPKLFKKKKGETLYTVRLIPAGGFCAMEGEDEESSDERAFCNKSVWRRILVVFAGAFNNILLGLVFVMIMLVIQGSYGTTVISSFKDGAASNAADGLEAGDKIIEIDGRNVYCSDDISYMMTSSEDEYVDITVVRSGEKVSLNQVRFERREYEGNMYITIDFIVVGKRCSFKHPMEFVKEAVLETVSIARLVWMSLVDLLAGRYGLNDIMGPVGTVSTVSRAAKQSFMSLLYMMSLITVNLGIFNLLPFPALDGGRIVLLAAEGITRKKIPAKYEAAINFAGLAVLMIFMIVVTGNDILRWFRN